MFDSAKHIFEQKHTSSNFFETKAIFSLKDKNI